MTPITTVNPVPESDVPFFKQMQPQEASVAVAQMMSYLSSGLTREYGSIARKQAMLDSQPWYKRMIHTITGRNKATVAEIRQHHDRIGAYTAQAVALLYRAFEDTQIQVVTLGDAVNDLNYNLMKTNIQLLETQESVERLEDQLQLAIEKIDFIDFFNMLVHEIQTDKIYKGLTGFVQVMSQIDQRTAEDNRKLNILRVELEKNGILNDEKHKLFDYVEVCANLSGKELGIAAQKVSMLKSSAHIALIEAVFDGYSYLPSDEKAETDLSELSDEICGEMHLNPSAEFSTNEVFDYFVYLHVEKMFYSGKYKKALPYIIQYAEEKHYPRAMYLLSLYYEYGFNIVPIDMKKAFKYYIQNSSKRYGIASRLL